MINGWENEGGSVLGGGIDDRILHAEITYWKEGKRDHELWSFEEMVYLPASQCLRWMSDPSPLADLIRMVDQKLTSNAKDDAALKIQPISYRTISVKDVR